MLSAMNATRLTAWMLVLVAAGAMTACTPKPPPQWALGGTPLMLGQASWQRGDDDPVVLHQDGTVTQDDDVLFRIDTAGRVFEEDGEPIAILLPGNVLVGTDDVALGVVGPHSASFPGSPYAWLSLGRSGQVIRYDPEGERSVDGQWTGCTGYVTKTCTLISHLIALEEWRNRPRVGIGVGIGVGVMH